MLSVFTIQWGIIVVGVVHKLWAEDVAKAFESKINMDITTMIKGDFACGAVLISMGAVLGKLSYFQLLVMAFFEVIF